MADTKTSALTDGTTANSTDRLPAARTTDGGITWSNVYVTPGYIKTATIGAGSVSIASGKTFTSSNTLTLAGTDSTTITFGSASSSFPIVTSPTAATLQLGAADAAGTTTTSLTFNTTTDRITWTSHGLATGNAIEFSVSGGSLPSPLSSTTVYYVRSIDANTIELYSTYDNATASSGTTGIIDLTTTGSGTITARSATPQQKFRVQSFTGTDIPGQPFVIQGSRGTGLGDGGSIIFQVAPAVSSGTAQNAYSTALTIASNRDATFGGRVFGSVFGLNTDNCVNTASNRISLIANGASQFDAANGYCAVGGSGGGGTLRIKRVTDGVLQVYTDDSTAFGAIRTGATTVAALPTASTAGIGSRAFVTDANATTYASVVAGGGANKVPVYSDGTNWLIG